jgi:hypothetical protein
LLPQEVGDGHGDLEKKTTADYELAQDYKYFKDEYDGDKEGFIEIQQLAEDFYEFAGEEKHIDKVICKIYTYMKRVANSFPIYDYNGYPLQL